MRKPPEKKKRPRSTVNLSSQLREYLAYIGTIGGQTSRRELSRTQAKQMVMIRETKRRALKEGKLELAQKRVPLPKQKINHTRRPYPIRPSHY